VTRLRCTLFNKKTYFGSPSFGVKKFITTDTDKPDPTAKKNVFSDLVILEVCCQDVVIQIVDVSYERVLAGQTQGLRQQQRILL
jgi:hypothetical protein